MSSRRAREGCLRSLPFIELHGVEKSFRATDGSDYVAVKDFNRQIVAHELFCLPGPRGRAKTTVLNMLAEFELPGRGLMG